MKTIDHDNFIELLTATLELYGAKLTPAAISIWIAALSEYELSDVRAALSAHVKNPENGRFAPKPADLIGQMPDTDGRPGADEAWAMIPRSEAASAVMSEEMAGAMGIAQPLLDEGDQVAARMAFKEAYTRIVDANKRAGIKPKWFPSLGFDVAGRDAALSEAVRLGRIGQNHAIAIGMVPPLPVGCIPELAKTFSNMPQDLKE